MTNIVKGEALPVSQFMNGFFTISTGKKFVNADMFNHSFTCKEWKMVGIPCENAYAAILSIGQNVADFVDDWYKFPKQELIYLGSFHGIDDELKSHPFSVHFSDLFLSKKTALCA